MRGKYNHNESYSYRENHKRTWTILTDLLTLRRESWFFQCQYFGSGLMNSNKKYVKAKGDVLRLAKDVNHIIQRSVHELFGFKKGRKTNRAT